MCIECAPDPGTEVASAPEPAKKGLSAEQVQQQTQAALQQIYDELKDLKGSALRSRLRQLQLSWHPDHAWRRGIESIIACRVFIYVQELWEREAKELRQRLKVEII
jgi:hypothetical protein